MEHYLKSIFLKLFHWDPPRILLMILVAAIIAGFISITVLFLIWLERKVSARIQRRMGPMLAGPKFLAQISMWLGGIFQTAADAGKLMFKEDIIPRNANRLIFVIAPFVVLTATIMAYLVIPFGPGVIITDLNVGFLYILAITTFTVVSIIMAGWSANNKYSLLGGMRSAAQIISYEVPLIFSLLGVPIMAGTLSMNGIVEAQSKGFFGWFILPQLVGFLVFMCAATAEVNRPPFDIPEAESELTAGYHTEYSGMKFAMYFLAEFSNMFISSAVAVTLFLGGWTLPFGITIPRQISMGFLVIPYTHIIGGIVVFLIKTYIVILLFMWIRWTYPRLRIDQLMNFGWKVLLPLSFVNLMIVCVLALIVPEVPFLARFFGW